VRQKVDEISAALISGNFAKVVDLTYPKVVQMVGGREKMIDLLKAGTQEMLAHGSAITAVVVGTPSEFRTVGKEVFVVVPSSITLSVPGGKLTQKSFTVGVSSDAGRTWFFVDANNLGGEKIKMVFPTFPATLQLPPRPPVFERMP
jgi:hypothetical protein